MNSKNNVSVGKPKVGGAVFRAPSGTTLPTSATETLGSAFKDLGYISDDGLKHSNSIESEEIKAWGGDTVLTPQTGKTDSFSLTFIEMMNEEVLKTVYGNTNVSGTLANGISILANGKELEESCYVIDMILTNNVKKRIVIPDGKVTEIGDITYKDDEAVGYEVTITALPDSSENTHYEYYAQGSGSD